MHGFECDCPICKKIQGDIHRVGHSVMMTATQDGLPFAYTVGVQRTHGSAELIVLGLPFEVASSLLNTAVKLVAAGEIDNPPCFDVELFEGNLRARIVEVEESPEFWQIPFGGNGFWQIVWP